jgi:hypothetical protein
MVAPISTADRTSNQAPSVSWNCQNRESGWTDVQLRERDLEVIQPFPRAVGVRDVVQVPGHAQRRSRGVARYTRH